MVGKDTCMYLLQCSDRRHELQLYIRSVDKILLEKNISVIDDSVARDSVFVLGSGRCKTVIINLRYCGYYLNCFTYLAFQKFTRMPVIGTQKVFRIRYH